MQNKDLIHKLIEIGAVVDDEKAETLLMAVKALEMWNKLYCWLNDYALGIAPEKETERRQERQIQCDTVREIMTIMDEIEDKAYD